MGVTNLVSIKHKETASLYQTHNYNKMDTANIEVVFIIEFSKVHI